MVQAATKNPCVSMSLNSNCLNAELPWNFFQAGLAWYLWHLRQLRLGFRKPFPCTDLPLCALVALTHI